MIVAVAARLERFHKPELDAAHTPRLQAYRPKTRPTLSDHGQSSLACRPRLSAGVSIPLPGITDNWDLPHMTSLDSFKCRKTLKVGGKTYVYYSLPTAEKNGLKGISRLPYSMKVLLENLLRNEDGRTVKKEDILAVAKWLKKRKLEHEIAFRPARVLMQDFTGVPAVVDLAAMRNAMQALGGDAEKINPLVPVDLVIDHSVIVNFFGDNKAFAKNVVEEYKQNQERYEFLKWGQKAFSNFSVVPPATENKHQVNLEYLAQTVWTRKEKMTVGKKTGTFEIAY